jgi:hypothetical protein
MIICPSTCRRDDSELRSSKHIHTRTVLLAEGPQGTVHSFLVAFWQSVSYFSLRRLSNIYEKTKNTERGLYCTRIGTKIHYKSFFFVLKSLRWKSIGLICV